MQIIILLVLAAGLFFFVVGVVGLLRLPDIFCRLHATTKCDTLGAGFIILALMLYNGLSHATVKLAVILIFIWITNPTAAHVIARASYYMRRIDGKGGNNDMNLEGEGRP